MPLRDHLTWENGVRHRYRIGATVLFLAALGSTVGLAIWASSEKAPNGAQSALLVLIAAFFQGASIWAFGKNRPSLEMTKTAVRHIAKIGMTVSDARQLADAAVDDGRGEFALVAIRELSVRLSGIQLQVTTNLEDWVEAFPEILPNNDLEK